MAIHTVGTKQQREGWMVVRMAPWNVIGVFDDITTARSIATSSGPEYVIRRGSVPADGDYRT